MYELINVKGNSFYIESPAKIGLYKLNDTEVCLIDSGNNKDTGKKIKRILDENGWTLKAIYNTHSNADHIGGNKFLQDRTGCKIYTPGIECDFTNHTVLEPAFLYGGYPCKDLRHRFLMAQESNAENLTPDVLPEGFEMISLPGHFFDMVGFKTPDNVIYLADCLSSRTTLEKYQISVLYDVEAYLKTLEDIKTLKADVFVPSHAEQTEDITELAQFNIDKVYEISEKILEICKTPVNFENLLKRLFDEYSLDLNFDQYVLVGSTVKSYLSWLKDNEKLIVEFKDNMLLWKTIV